MVSRIAALPAALAIALPSAAQSDLDALMARVLARRDDNWTKLQQFVVNERETVEASGAAGIRMLGSRRDYLWYPRNGRFIKSPLTANGETVGEAERERFEQEFLARQERRNRLEPGFVSAAYFLRFTFDPGHYALVGRETYHGRDVLRVEYYPTKMFREGRSRPNRELRERDSDVERKMNKSALVTMWVLPEEQQIVKYDFQQIDLDFMPGRMIARIDDVSAGMEMSQPFPGVWLPKTLRIAFKVTTAAGDGEAQYTSEYYDYRLASVGVRVR